MDDSQKNNKEQLDGKPDADAQERNPQLNSVEILGGERMAAAPGKVQLPADKSEPPIGVAVLKDPETIVLHLKGKTGTTTGEAEVEYRRGDLYYDDVFKHIGGIKKGETKLVPPWKDDAGKKPAKQDVIAPKDTAQEPVKDAPKDTPQEPVKDESKDPQKKPAENSDVPKDPKDSTDAKDPKDPKDAKDASGQPIDQTGKPILVDVIIAPSAQFTLKVNDTISKMSAETREVLVSSQTEIVAANRLTDALPDLKGQKPRGWPPGLTWDAVDGAYSPSLNMVVVAEETEDANGKWVKSNRTEDVTRHEVGHAVDFGLGKLSNTAAFTKAYEDDEKNMPAKLAAPLKYFLQNGDGGKEEACAEAIAAREGGSTGGSNFDVGFKKTIAAVDAALLLRRAKLPVSTIVINVKTPQPKASPTVDTP